MLVYEQPTGKEHSDQQQGSRPPHHPTPRGRSRRVRLVPRSRGSEHPGSVPIPFRPWNTSTKNRVHFVENAVWLYHLVGQSV